MWERARFWGWPALSGPGRSEAAQAIFGADKALAGTFTIGELEIKVRTPKEAIEHGIYLIPEDRRHVGLIGEFCVRENITLPDLERYSSAGLINRNAERENATPCRPS